MIKNDAIKAAMAKTKARHKDMSCRVYVVKVTSGKLSHEKENHIKGLFTEAKWLRNAVVGSGDAFAFDRGAKSVPVKVGCEFEDRVFRVIGSQMKQDIVDSVKSEIRGLATKKAKGEKVGGLKFKSYCNSVPLRQYGTTYRIDFDKGTISIQGLKKPIKVRGLKQIPGNTEIANAKLIRKPSGLYFHITTYCDKEETALTGATVGIDFGIRANMTLSTGEEINITVPETKSVKRNSKAVNKSLVKSGRKKGANHRKRVHELQIAYEKQTNKKRDFANKAVSKLLREYDFIAIQDEMIANWHKGLFGKQVQHSAMGFIKAKLGTNSKVHVVARDFPSTQKCPVCEKNTKHPLELRHFKCGHCGYCHHSRDVKSAGMILSKALKQVCVERTAKGLVEAGTTTARPRAGGKFPPVKQEAQLL